MGDFDYEELDKAIKDLYLTDDDGEKSESDSNAAVADDKMPSDGGNHKSVVKQPASHRVTTTQSVHVAAVSSNGATSTVAKAAKSIAITSDNEELVPVHKANYTDVFKPRPKQAKKIVVAADESDHNAVTHSAKRPTFRSQSRARTEVSGRNFRGNVSRRNDDVDIDVRTPDDIVDIPASSNNAKPFTINKNGADMAQPRRRAIHYGARRAINVAQTNPQRSLSQPLPKPVAFVPHVDIEAEPEPKTNKVPYEVPFLPDAKVEKRPLGGGEKVKVPVDPAVIGAVNFSGGSVAKKSLPDLKLITDNKADNESDRNDDVSSDDKADQIARDLLHNGTPDDDFIGEFLRDVKKRRHDKKVVVDDVESAPTEQVDIPVSEHLTEPKKSEPVIGAAVAKVVNGSNHKSADATPVTDNTKPVDLNANVEEKSVNHSDSAATVNTAASRSANLNRYQTKYTPKRGGGSWGWILLFILALIGGTFVGVALYYYGL